MFYNIREILIIRKIFSLQTKLNIFLERHECWADSPDYHGENYYTGHNYPHNFYNFFLFL